MDADALIKISKAGLKEMITNHFRVSIPKVVELEVVSAGLVKNFPDAILVQENISKKRIIVLRSNLHHANGDIALQKEFDRKKFDAVSTDDAKLIRFLRGQNIPCLIPAVLILSLCQSKKITNQQGLQSLLKLKPFISPEEFSSVKLLLEGGQWDT